MIASSRGSDFATPENNSRLPDSVGVSRDRGEGARRRFLTPFSCGSDSPGETVKTRARRARENRILILGAAGRDFHNFHTVYRDDPSSRVVAFTATQIPGIAGRRYPAVLAGPRYPEGIPIFLEEELPRLIRDERIDTCVFSYSDVTHEHVMHLASLSIAVGADFLLLSADRTMLRSKVPVIAVTAVRTGAGKSQTTRYLSGILKKLGKKVVGA